MPQLQTVGAAVGAGVGARGDATTDQPVVLTTSQLVLRWLQHAAEVLLFEVAF